MSWLLICSFAVTSSRGYTPENRNSISFNYGCLPSVWNRALCIADHQYILHVERTLKVSERATRSRTRPWLRPCSEPGTKEKNWHNKWGIRANLGEQWEAEQIVQAEFGNGKLWMPSWGVFQSKKPWVMILSKPWNQFQNPQKAAFSNLNYSSYKGKRFLSIKVFLVLHTSAMHITNEY